MINYFVVLPFKRGFRNRLQAEQPRQVKNEEQAKSLAERLSRTCPAVVAFSRRGDPTTGDYEDAVILAQYGQVPDELLDMAG